MTAALFREVAPPLNFAVIETFINTVTVPLMCAVLATTLFFFVRTKFIRMPSLRFGQIFRKCSNLQVFELLLR